MVPTFDKFLYPVLKTLGDGHERMLKDLIKNLIYEHSDRIKNGTNFIENRQNKH